MVLDALAHVSLFQSLPPEELEGLLASVRTVDLAPGAILFREGDTGEHFYVILEGRVEILKNLGLEGERRLALRGPGEFFGEMGLFRLDSLRTASVRALDTAHLVEMTRTDFDRLLQRNPLLGYAMVQVLGERLNHSHNQAIEELKQINRQLVKANEELKAAQAQLIQKEKLERELQLAHEIQMSILPQELPRMDGYDFGALLVPARAVGGDFFDLITLGKNKLGIVIGDVTDKGMPAAIFMAQAHALLRALASSRSGPRETLQRVNRQLLQMNASGLFVTAVYGILEQESGLFTYARAGHEIPLLLRASGVEQAASREGQPLGLFDRFHLDEQVIHLMPGEAVLLFTDGIPDALDAQQKSFGRARLQAALREAAGLGGQETCGRIYQSICAHQAGADLFDDLTLVAVRRESG
ncbi:MAG TPA: SpoIIE family protein phosphatase [Anaerolineaceae bacterium]|nr:SpoIIE family protein phosphatase [Anaerolineaceae bacterium]